MLLGTNGDFPLKRPTFDSRRIAFAVDWPQVASSSLFIQRITTAHSPTSKRAGADPGIRNENRVCGPSEYG